MKSGYTHLRCGLIGEHLGHSFSPIIHRELADYSYNLFELAPDEVESFIKDGKLDAFNVTIPYKKAVMPYLDIISPEALSIGAVNTVVRQADGTLHGYNTDYFGFDYMIEASGIDVCGKKAIVLGSGGASVTVCAVLRDRGAREICVIARKDNTPEVIQSHSDAEIIVNTTPVGMYPSNGLSPVDLSLFPNCCGVLDVIYNPARTKLILDAEERGIPAVSGLSMLVAQAVKAFSYFTGEDAPRIVFDTTVQKISALTQNIILIGMPGCGKSTVGRLIAERLGRPFYDADEVFAKMHGRTPADIIVSDGENRFRALEHLTLCELGKKSSCVIACGGGAVTREYNYAPLHQNGVIIFLERNLDKLPTDGRPISQKNSLSDLYDARIGFYHRFADLEIRSTESPERTAEQMLASLAAMNKGEFYL